jgi:hypothetical protein
MIEGKWVLVSRQSVRRWNNYVHAAVEHLELVKKWAEKT